MGAGFSPGREGTVVFLAEADEGGSQRSREALALLPWLWCLRS